MEILTKLLYWISTGLMLPVVTILLFLFVRSLIALGGFYSDFMARLKATQVLKPFLQEVKNRGLIGQAVPEGKLPLFEYMQQLLGAKDSPVNRERVLTEYELAMSKKLATTKNMSKLGPILGLMGTLIPMGPALVGLASGDIASMAENMQVAFATTVVGLIVGAIGFILSSVKQRWYAKDFSQLTYITDLITEENEKA